MNLAPFCDLDNTLIIQSEEMKETLPPCTKSSVSKMQSELASARTVGEVVLALHKAAHYNDLPKSVWEKIIYASRCSEPI